MRKLERTEAHLYFELLPKEHSVVLTELRDRMMKLAKADDEVIMSYQLPTIQVRGKKFLAMAAWNNFYSIYFLNGNLGSTISAELKQGELDKATLRFGWDEKVSNATLKTIIAGRKKQLNFD
ncbi:MAG: DUF1801 domain-containing protein [Rhodoluna sp.]|nr:DUF1801 domain-containing protein [Rhodoluna sp.]